MLLELGLNVRAAPSPMPSPGQPNSFRIVLQGGGAIELHWKCKHPRRAAGAAYQVFRRNAPDQPFTYLGTTGNRSFVDSTLPRGLGAITYRVRAIRSTAMGEPADFNVSFGTSSVTQASALDFQPRTRRQAA